MSMILVTGGYASGKKTYVRQLGYSDEQLSADPHSDRPVLTDLEELLRHGPLDASLWDIVRAKEVIICCEVGLGVVPLDREERTWRELVGKTCIRLAAEAEQVVRMTCGIPRILKQG